MLKLFKTIEGQLHYWETWDTDEQTVIVHWGVVGETGYRSEVKSAPFSNFRKTVRKEINQKKREGYEEFDEDNLAFLEIEYKTEGFGTEEDLRKRYRLEEHLDELLGWTGLGQVDGSSIGSGSMEVGCVVVDFDIAKSVIEQELKGTEFGDYTRIYRMEEDELRDHQE